MGYKFGRYILEAPDPIFQNRIRGSEKNETGSETRKVISISISDFYGVVKKNFIYADVCGQGG